MDRRLDFPQSRSGQHRKREILDLDETGFWLILMM
jgi:hypothetical protein